MRQLSRIVELGPNQSSPASEHVQEVSSIARPDGMMRVFQHLAHVTRGNGTSTDGGPERSSQRDAGGRAGAADRSPPRRGARGRLMRTQRPVGLRKT